MSRPPAGGRLVAYRHAAYDTPWWAFPSSRSGRFHLAVVDTVQYLCLHPLGPAAEVLRHNVGPGGDADGVLLNLWAVILDDPEALVRVGFDNCTDFGLAPAELVGDDYAPTQQLGDRLRADGAPGLIVPSAALPGTENVVLFGPRVAHPYLSVPLSAAEVATGHLSDGARPAREVLPLVRWIGAPHRSLQEWSATGSFEVLADPMAARW